jgi:hypothetical protein
MISIVVLGDARAALAGMPVILLNDLARMRIQTISFFLLCLLICSWVIGKIWNALRADFPWLPYLTYRKATGLVVLWGLLFALILTMISGARELMTPGAWRKEGLTYKLAETEEHPAAESRPPEKEVSRLQALDRLRIALWTYARHHEGHFPKTSSAPEILEEVWRVPGPSRMKYLYTPGLVADRGATPLAYEPGLFGKDRFVLLTSGQIVRMSDDELRRGLAGSESS